jgi:membrane protease YdiL (CAAX protease family)
MHVSSGPIFRVSVIAVVLLELSTLLVRSAVEVKLADANVSLPLAKDLSFLVVPPLLFVLLLPYLLRCKSSLFDLLRPTDLTFRVVILSITLGFVLRATRWAVLTILIATGIVRNDDPGAVVGPVLGFQCPEFPTLLLSFLVMSFLVPAVEEIVNRGFILHALLPRGKLLSVLVSSLLFATMHEPGTYITAFFVGLFFAAQVINFRTLWAPLIAHATYNAVTVVDWDCFRFVWNPPQGDATISILAAVSAPVAIIGIVTSIFLVGKKAVGAESGPRPQQRID